ncbi:MAG: recombinase family protein [Actinobacteria bacterium]|nr:recombinase family protein [Actinomycetota bacterium]
MVTIATYARISRDADGRAEGTEQQRKKATAYAAKTWPDATVVHYADNDLSAADPGTHRPGYHALLDAVRRGEVDGVVVAEQSRFTRQPAEWEEALVTLSLAGIEEVHAYRGSPIPVRGSRLVGRILAAVDAEEVERLRARVVERLDTLAAEGRPPGGPSYGYDRSTDDNGRKVLIVNEAEADVIREMADRVLAGWSLTRIAADLSERGVPTARGGRWAATTVRSTVTRPTLAGLRVHRGEVVGEGTWTPILPVSMWRQVCAVLDGPVNVSRPDGTTYHRSSRRRQRSGRRYLLTGGVARCGRCGAALVAQQRRSRAGGRQPSYLCPPRERGGCAGIGILAADLENYVSELLLDKLAQPDFLAALAKGGTDDREQIVADLAALESRSAELAGTWAAGGLSSADWKAAREVLDAERGRLTSALADLPVPVDFGIAPSELGTAWVNMNLDERRAIIGRFLESVVVLPAQPGTRWFDPGRVQEKWRI